MAVDPTFHNSAAAPLSPCRSPAATTNPAVAPASPYHILVVPIDSPYRSPTAAGDYSCCPSLATAKANTSTSAVIPPMVLPPLADLASAPTSSQKPVAHPTLGPHHTQTRAKFGIVTPIDKLNLSVIDTSIFSVPKT